MNHIVLPQMPYYSQDIIVPELPPGQHLVLYVRYYGLWNNGNRGPVSPSEVYWPIVSMNGVKLESTTTQVFSSSALVHVYAYIAETGDVEQKINIEGFFEQVGYCSISLYQYLEPNTDIAMSELAHVEGKDFTMISGLNPFIPGNPSVFSYQSPTPKNGVEIPNNTDYCPKKEHNIKQVTESRVCRGLSTVGDGDLGLYKVTVEDVNGATYGFVESVSEDGCSPNYLLAFRNPEEDLPSSDLLMLKMLMPSTFISSDTPDTVYKGYQLQELTIDSSFDLNLGAPYSLTSRQLNDFKDEDGYVHVFFAPDQLVEDLRIEQGCAYGIPPVYTWNGITGYLLIEGPMIIRHRGIDPSWEGNLDRAPCYLTSEDEQPVSSEYLGAYCPILLALE